MKTLAEARKLDAKFIRDRYDEFMWNEGMMMVTCLDGNICVGDPIRLFAQGKYGNVPVMAGNTEDEFPSKLIAENEAQMRERARELFGDKAEEFLRCPEAVKPCEGGFAQANGIECTVKSSFLLNEKSENKQDCYYYRFAPDMPGWDNPGTFHSSELWFFFETLAKCWRPFVGRHYDLARKMCNYWANFIKTGNPNGQDADGSEMPVWEPYNEASRSEMVFTGEGPVTQREEDSAFIKLLMERIQQQLAQ